MAQLAITLTGHDHRALDTALGRVLAAIPAAEVAEVEVELLAREAGAQGRRVLVTDASEKVVPLLARLDLPDVVGVSARERD